MTAKPPKDDIVFLLLVIGFLGALLFIVLQIAGIL